MTIADYLALAPRDLDARVAERVIGWKRGNRKAGDMNWLEPTTDKRYPRGWHQACFCPEYSTDHNHMALVLARLRALHPTWEIEFRLPVNAGLVHHPEEEDPGLVSIWDERVMAEVPFADVMGMPRAVAMASLIALEDKP